MRVCLISDTHTKENFVRIEPTDLLIHAGDITFDGNMFDLQRFADWIKAQPAGEKVVIAGNHDWCFVKPYERTIQARKILEDAGVIYLQDSGVEIEGLRIWGTPWSNEFCGWAFMHEEPELASIWKKIPEETNILVVHEPPKGAGDLVRRGERVGSATLVTAVAQRPSIKLIVTGHIHEDYGEHALVLDDGARTVPVYNASSCNLAYAPVNPPIVLEI